MGVGERIIELRTRRGLSQKDLADKIGITQPEISRVERNKTHRSRFLPMIAKALGCDVHELDPEAYPAATMDHALPVIPLIDWGDLSGDLRNPERTGEMQISLVGGSTCIATTLPDSSFNLRAPPGSTLVIDTASLELVPEQVYLFIHDGRPLVRIFRNRPDRMHPASSDPAFETEHMSQRTKVIGQLRVAILHF
jgi:Predicted transcriptional regulators